MKSDIEYLTLFEKDLREAGQRERWMKTAPLCLPQVLGSAGERWPPP